MNILITGGAGYIGSHVLKALLERATDKITVIDNFYSGSQDALVALESVGKFDFIKCDLADTAHLKEIFASHKFDAIIHFAAYITSKCQKCRYTITSIIRTHCKK